ncbi:MAG: molybdopterin molybdotransferase MoeA [Spirochaetales bacterium]
MFRNLHPDEAIALIIDAAKRLWPTPPIERVPLAEAAGRALVKPIESPIDHPPFDKSAMDGFAFSETTAEGVYRVVDAVAAGRASGRGVRAGEIVRIMTGAPLPMGTRGVQRVEWTQEAGNDEDGTPLVTFTKRETADNIIRRGENLKKGDPMLSPRILAAQDVGILASSGFAAVEVSGRPIVGVVSTGDEIEEAGTPLPGASIYDSNGPQLCAQVSAAGAEARFYGILRDREEALTEVLSQALDECDLVLVSGGVSMGDFDLVPSILEKLGVEPVFHSLAMRPGKPTFFGIRENVAVFGLPGNPVSTFVNFEVLVKHFLYTMMGLEYTPATTAARLDSPLTRKGTDRVEFLPARLLATKRGMSVRPLDYHGSSMITVLADANALLRMELGQSFIEEGAIVDARRIRA